MIGFKQFVLTEGGNIKVKTPTGEVSAAPFKVRNRQQQAGDMRDALSALHDSFKQETGKDLFGKDRRALSTGSAFAGSTRHLMDNGISDEEFTKHKKEVGDIDAQVDSAHRSDFEKHLTPGRQLGKYTLLGTKKHGNEISAVLRHENGEHHQVDFEPVEYNKGEPTAGEQFLHSAHWGDTQSGIKGAHHKILLNAIGLNDHKFSITHGLRSRMDENDPGEKDPIKISRRLFGDNANHGDVYSFKGLTNLIKNNIPKEKHQAIYDKFKAGVSSQKGYNHDAALSHMRNELGVKDTVSESADDDTHHTTVIPMVGFSPISHMGHAADLGGAISRLPGTRHLGISSKADVFTPTERKSILDRQWGDTGTTVHIVSGAGETVRRAHDSLPKGGRKVLHLLVGKDRESWAHGLKSSLEQGKVKEMEGRKFDEIHVHVPEDTERTHGMSGTKMRNAAANDAADTFHDHLGPMFSRAESEKVRTRIKDAIQSGQIAVKRK